MKVIGLALINCFLILFTVLIHKIIYRLILFNYESLIMYWGLFVSIFFILNILINIIFIKDHN